MIKKAILTTGIVFLTYSPVNGETNKYQEYTNNLLNNQTYLTSPIQDYSSPIPQNQKDNNKEGGLEFLIPKDFIVSSGDKKLIQKIKGLKNIMPYYKK